MLGNIATGVGGLALTMMILVWWFLTITHKWTKDEIIIVILASIAMGLSVLSDYLIERLVGW